MADILSNTAQQVMSSGMNIPFYQQEYDYKLNEQYKNWQRQVDYLNQYNSPLNQLGRLKQAGLNPALAYSGITNTSGSSASMSSASTTPPSVANTYGPLEYQQLRTNKEQETGQKIQNAIASEQLQREKIMTDEAEQEHITKVYQNQNAFRSAVAQGNLFYNPIFARGWRDRTGSYNFMANPSFNDGDGRSLDYYAGSLGNMLYGNRNQLAIQYDPALLSDYIAAKLYADNDMLGYNTHIGEEGKINQQNQTAQEKALLDYTNLHENFGSLTDIYKLALSQDKSYMEQTFDKMTAAAIAGFEEALAKNNLLTKMHLGGYLGNESPLLRFFGKKIGHDGWDSLYSPGNYFKIKGDALWNAVSQMGVDVLGAYLSRGAHRPFDPQKPFDFTDVIVKRGNTTTHSRHY